MNNNEPLIYVYEPTRPNKNIKLTAADRRVKPMTGMGSIISDMNKITTPMPSQKDAPELYSFCPKCGVTPPQWVLKKWYKRSCPCKAEERQKQEEQERFQAWLRAQEVNCYGGWLGSTHKDLSIVKTMVAKTFDTFESEPGDTTVRAARAYAMAPRPRGNKAFVGSFGTGKTHLGSAILNYRREHYRESTLFASAPQFFVAYEEAKKMRDQHHFLSLMQKVVEAKIFYFDDIDKEWRGEWRQPELHSVYYYIFDERYKARRPTIISINDMDNLERYIGAAAKSRLMSLCEILPMYGEDFRPLEDW